jgi:hypothetical protein
MVLYLLQTLILGLALLWLTSSGTIAHRWHIVAWVLLTSTIFIRYGNVEQLLFYSSDQVHHVQLVQHILDERDWWNTSWWLFNSRAPYTIPAAVLSLVGIDVALALKTVALGYLLGTVSFIRTIATSAGLKPRISTLFMTATGPIGVLFASLALRETAMMFFVLHSVRTPSPVHRISALCMLGLLRPHLAAAVLFGAIAVELAGRFRRADSSMQQISALVSLVAGTLFGSLLFEVGSMNQASGYLPQISSLDVQRIVRVSSNFVGLQFLTAPDYTVDLSISQLFLFRLLLSETVLIPLLFSLVVLTSRKVDRYSQLALWSFSIYVGLVTNTDNNSFRQNLPLMPLMGLSILQILQRGRWPKGSSERFKVRSGTLD